MTRVPSRAVNGGGGADDDDAPSVGCRPPPTAARPLVARTQAPQRRGGGRESPGRSSRKRRRAGRVDGVDRGATIDEGGDDVDVARSQQCVALRRRECEPRRAAAKHAGVARPLRRGGAARG